MANDKSTPSNSQQPYPAELSQFLIKKAALVDDDEVSTNDAPLGAPMGKSLIPMPPEFELVHPRRVRCSGFFTQTDGSSAHYTGYMHLTADDESHYRMHDPENGLHPEDLRAFQALTQRPASDGLFKRLLVRWKFLQSVR